MRVRLVLIPSPLAGWATWEPVAGELARAGYAVTVPDLAGALAAGPPYHQRQAQAIADSAAGQPAILAGYSRGGPLLSTAGAMLGEAVQPGKRARVHLLACARARPGSRRVAA
jgi:pimeloyl-ACP methyl ester carboxylesterase